MAGMMEEYHGELIGGPDNGNVVTASKPEISAISTTELWLDGEDEGKTSNIIITKGAYIWQESERLFLWEEESTSIYSKKEEAA